MLLLLPCRYTHPSLFFSFSLFFFLFLLLLAVLLYSVPFCSSTSLCNYGTLSRCLLVVCRLPIFYSMYYPILSLEMCVFSFSRGVGTRPLLPVNSPRRIKNILSVLLYATAKLRCLGSVAAVHKSKCLNLNSSTA